MEDEDEHICAEAAGGAATGGILAAASSIATGIAVGSTPVKLLGLITLGTTTAISWPLVLAVGAGGALLGGIASAMSEVRRQEDIKEEFQRLIGKDD